MPFDMNQLFENPGFVFGASLLGNARAPGAMNQAFGIANQVNAFKQQKQNQNDVLAQNAARYAQNAKYEDSQIEQQKAETAFKTDQNKRLERSQRADQALKARQLMMQQQVMSAMAQRYGLDPRMFQMPQGMSESLDEGDPQQQQGAQSMNAMQNPPQGQGQSALNMPPVQGMIGGAQMQPTPQVPQGIAPPQPMQPFDPSGVVDPAGPRPSAGGLGAPGLNTHRPMQKTNAFNRALEAQESGGRNVTSIDGARGPRQITPGTWAQYARPGERMDNPADNRAVGDRITADLARRTGGDPAKMAVGYFSGPGNINMNGPTPYKRDAVDGNGKRTSAYVNDILGRLGGATPTGATSAFLQGTPVGPVQTPGMAQGNPALQDAQLGALMSLAGMKGGPEMQKAAEMSQPKNVPTNSYQVGPDGTSTYFGDPYKPQEMSQAERRVAAQEREANARAQEVGYNTGAGAGPDMMSPKDISQAKQQIVVNEAQELHKAYDSKVNIGTQYKAVLDAQQVLPKTSFVGIGKQPLVKSLNFLNNTLHLGIEEANQQNAEILQKDVAQAVISRLKQMDSNPSERQQKYLEQAVGNLQTDPKALAKILQFQREVIEQDVSKHNQRVGNLRKRGFDPGDITIDLGKLAGPQAAAQGEAMSLDDYIAKHRSK